ncbi:MAG: adenosylcobinamide amidohydrolase [Methanobacteriota archaeon]
MRYYLTRDTLIIRGTFRSCSTGISGGIKNVTSLLNHTVSDTQSSLQPNQAVEIIARRAGLSPESTFGLLTAVPITQLCIVRYDSLTVFITAGITHPDPGKGEVCTHSESLCSTPGTINIICCISGGVTDQGLLDAIITVTEAKTLALRGLGHRFAGTITDAVIIATEGEGTVRYAGSATRLGHQIHEAVLFGVTHALETGAHDVSAGQNEPAFFIHSTIGGARWIKWQKGGCPYYPCHFSGQRCEFCYCPLYPCEDEELGEWTSSSQRKERVWSCAPCTLNHQSAVVHHLRRNPEASIQELKSLLRHQSDLDAKSNISG